MTQVIDSGVWVVEYGNWVLQAIFLYVSDLVTYGVANATEMSTQLIVVVLQHGFDLCACTLALLIGLALSVA